MGTVDFWLGFFAGSSISVFVLFGFFTVIIWIQEGGDTDLPNNEWFKYDQEEQEAEEL